MLFQKQGRDGYKPATISKVTPEGLMTDWFVFLSEYENTVGFAFDSTSNFRSNLFISEFTTNKLLEIDPDGNLSEFASGFSFSSHPDHWHLASRIAFGPDVAMYVSDGGAGTVWRIAPILGELDRIEITGPDEVAENSSVQYQAIAHYDDGSSSDVSTSATWSVVESDAPASIEEGLLQTDDVQMSQAITLRAEYSQSGVTVETDKVVTILAICPSGFALEFDGQNDQVNCGNLGITEPVTILMWLKPDDTLSDRRILGQLPETGNVAGSMAIKAIGDAHDIYVWNKYSWQKIVDLPSYWGDRWHHLAVVFRDDGSVVGFFDGIEQLNAISSFDFGSLSIGLGVKYQHYGKTYDGLMDEIAIFNRSLSAEEIQANMHRRLGGPEDGLVAYWGFDEGDGQVVHDSSLNANDGRLGSTPDVDDSDPAWVESDAPVGICNNVAVDIKPGGCPNPLNLNSRGVLPVAVLGSQDFDATTIDPGSIFLEDVPTIRSSYEDVSAPLVQGGECECTDAGPDGFIDLAVNFKTQAIVEELLIKTGGELVEGQVLEMKLTGQLYDGSVITGADCVVLVGNVPKWLAAGISDINEDGIVDMLDLSAVTKQWLEFSQP